MEQQSLFGNPKPLPVKQPTLRPLLACEVPLDKIRFPVFASAKLDGIRCLAINGIAYSRSMKPIRNRFIQEYFAEHNLHGLDGELCCGNNFQDCSSGIMSFDGKPQFTFYVFDYWDDEYGYDERLSYLSEYRWSHDVERVKVLEQIQCDTVEDIQKYYSEVLAEGYEGLIVRSPRAPYKQGRSTPKEQYLIKYKPYSDAEATIISLEEQNENTNIAELNELGYSQRSGGKDGLVGKSTLGAFVVNSKEYGIFNIGTGLGLDDSLRQEIWENKDSYIGRILKYKYQPFGVKDKPRFPVFIGFRDGDDL